MAGFLGGQQRKIPEGQFTQTIYTLIKDRKYAEAIQHLHIELQASPGIGANWATLTLLTALRFACTPAVLP